MTSISGGFRAPHNKPSAFETVIKKSRGYASQAGDARRQGRVTATAAARGALVAIQFIETSSHVEARLGVVTVGTATPDPTSGGFFWAVHLPGMSQAPRPARDGDKARDAIAHKVREWCEAALLISTRRAAP